MDDELDAGDIVLQRAVPVGPTDTTTDLFHRTLDLFGPITVEALGLIASGTDRVHPQDRSQASFFHKRAEEDSRIDWTWPAEDLERLVRAQSDSVPERLHLPQGAAARSRLRCRVRGPLRRHPGPDLLSARATAS